MATRAARTTIERQTLARVYARLGRFSGDPKGEDFCGLLGIDLNVGQIDIAQAIGSGLKRVVARFGRRSGKTAIAATLGAFETLKDDSTGWIVAPTHDLTSRAWEYTQRILCGNGPIHPGMPGTRGLGFQPSVRQSVPYRLAFPWGASIAGKTTQGEGKKSLDGESLTWCVWDECSYSDDAWADHLMPNLADRSGWCLFTGKPYGDNHFRDKWELGNPKNAERDPEWYACHYTSEVNFACQPNLRESFAEARRNWTEETFLQEWMAEFTSFAGQVYKEFREDVHCADLSYDPDLPLYLAIDFGTTNPFVCLWIQVTGGDVIRVIDEWTTMNLKTMQTSGLDIDEIGEDLMVYHAERDTETGKLPYGEIAWAVCDRSSPDDIRFLRRKYKIPTLPSVALARKAGAAREVPAGIEIVRRFLGRGRAGDENYQPPRLFVDRRRCPLTRYEFGRYRYPEKVGEVEAKENPAKLNDHSPDCVRMFCARRYGKAVELSDPDETETSPLEWARRKAERQAIERKQRHMAPSRWS